MFICFFASNPDLKIGQQSWIPIVRNRFENLPGYLQVLNVVFFDFLIKIDLISFFGLFDWTCKIDIRMNLKRYIKDFFHLNMLSDSNKSIPIAQHQFDILRFQSNYLRPPIM